MNRNNEYIELMDELETTPLQLDEARHRAEIRLKREQRRRLIILPLSSVAMILIMFTVLVNCFPTFAYACGRIPLIKDLAQLVAFSPSLSAAVENEYIQPIEQEQTINGMTARIEYVIVDQKQLNIFYSLKSDIYKAMDATPEIRSKEGNAMEEYSIGRGNWDNSNNELNFMTVDFVDNDMPEGLLFTLKVKDNGEYVKETTIREDEPQLSVEYEEPNYISQFTFTLDFDPYYTAQGETITVNQIFEIDGQTLTLEKAEIYPTHIRMDFSDVPENTAWLKSLSFYMKNEKGKKFDAISNGITATGSIDSPMMKSHRLESSFFSNSKELTLYIIGVDWLDKDKEKIKLDLSNVTADYLPQGVTFEKASRQRNNWRLVFGGKVYKKDSAYMIWNMNYYDMDGNVHMYNSWSTGMDGYWEEDNRQTISKSDMFYEEITLTNYPYDTVYMSPLFTRKVELSEPIKIKRK